ncbi:MAG: hypothetical protein E7Z89_00325 [Cyanobacteria bacterium SIG28]|nr:hypothetical protein [Cyanobacteria bacterium SIG28]
MGMGSSQARLLCITQRMTDIRGQLINLSNQKADLARDMRRVSENYQFGLNQKEYKWSTNNGVTYSELTYGNLMTPSAANQNTPYMISDTSGRIVLDKKYAEYAQIFSPDGAKGDWDTNRTQVLSKVTGIDPTKILYQGRYDAEVDTAKKEMEKLKATEPKAPQKKGVLSLLAKAGSDTGINETFSSSVKDWQRAYGYRGNNITISLGKSNGRGSTPADKLEKVVDTLCGALSKYFGGNSTLFEDACEDWVDNQKQLFGAAEIKDGENVAVYGDASNGYTINVTALIDALFATYGTKGGATNADGEYIWYDVDSSEYKNYEKNHAAWQTQYDNATRTYNDTLNNNNMLLTADEEKRIDFYEAIFSAVAENGWVTNEQVNDPDYLNQMFQNNLYTITTVKQTKEYDENTNQYDWDNFYTTNIASNFDNIFLVNDSDAQQEAMVEYEYEKSKINEKESRIDQRMQVLQTENAALQEEKEGIEQVLNDNIERTYSAMG